MECNCDRCLGFGPEEYYNLRWERRVLPCGCEWGQYRAAKCCADGQKVLERLIDSVNASHPIVYTLAREDWKKHFQGKRAHPSRRSLMKWSREAKEAAL